MEEYVEIPTELDTQDIEIRTCDDVTAASMTGTEGTQHFYIVQQTAEGLVIQIAEPNATNGGQSVSGLSKPVVGTTVMHINQAEASELLSTGDIAGLVVPDVTSQTPSGLVASTGDVVSELVAADDIVSVAASEIIAGDVVTSELIDMQVSDIQANSQGEDQCEATVVFDGGDSADNTCTSSDVTPAVDHAYTTESQQSVPMLVDNSLTAFASGGTANTTTEQMVPDSEAMVVVAEHEEANVSDGTTVEQQQVSNCTSAQKQLLDVVESDATSEEIAPQVAVGASDLSSKEDIAKAGPSRRVSTRVRKCRVTNETSSPSPDAAAESSSEELQPKIKAYQKWQRLPSKGSDDTDEASAPSSDVPMEKNEASKTSFTTVVPNRKMCYARKQSDETSESSSIVQKPNASDMLELHASKPHLLTEIDDIHSLRAEVVQLQKLNAELKSRMKQMERKSLLHHSDRKVLTGSSDRAMISGDRKIGINWKDMKFSVRKSASPRTTSPKESAENKAYLKKIDGLASQGRELHHREDMVEKKEQRLKALDIELDRRSSMIKCKEAKLERLESQLKARENALMTREKRLQNRENREEESGERVASLPPDEAKLIEREKQLRAKEKDLEVKQQLLKTTERQLTALGQELTDRFHYLQTKQGSRNVSIGMVTSIVSSQRNRRERATAGEADKLTASVGSDSNNNRRVTRTRTTTPVRKPTPLRATRQEAPPEVLKKGTKVAVSMVKRTNYVKTVGNALKAQNQRSTNKKQVPSKRNKMKPPGRAQKVVLKRKCTANAGVDKQSKRRKV